MERTKYKIILLLIISLTVPVKGSYRSEIYSAYIKNDMQKWKSIIDRMNTVKTNETHFLPELINYQYGYIAWCIGNNRNEEARKYLDLAEKNVTLLPQDNHSQSVACAYRSAFYGYRMGINRLLVTVLGMKSINCAKQAINLDRKNALAYIQYANIDFYMPSVFGGSKTKALKNYLLAEEIMETDRRELVENWNYLSLLSVIMQTYIYLHDYESSKMYYEKIIAIEPGLSSIKNDLYPEMINKPKK
jgi:tetratricopeptide (TPR) repeat protein